MTFKNKYSTNVRDNLRSQKFISASITASWKVSPLLTTSIIKLIFFQPKRYKLSAREKAYKERAQSFKIELRNKKIRGWRWGKGPSILLVHGWNSSGLQLYKFIDPLLEKGFSVITYDKPAHGLSEGRHTSYFEFTDVVRHLLKLPVMSDLAGIVAHSMGASAVINALSKENFIPKIVLFAPALSIKEILYDTFGRYGIPERILTQILIRYEKEYHYSIENDNPIALIPKIKSNTLIIHDKFDKSTPYQYSVKAAEMNSKIELFTTEDLGHGRILLDELLIDKSVSFLDN